MRTIGVLLTERTYQSIKKGTPPRSITFYEEVAILNKLSIVYTCPSQINDIYVETGLVYDANLKTFHEKSCPLPSIFYNRSSFNNSKSIKKVSSLIQTNIVVFNALPFRNGKHKINNILQGYETINKHLPKTAMTSESSLIKMMKKYSMLILKPCHSSKGKGIMSLEEVNQNQWLLIYQTKNGNMKEIGEKQQIVKLIMKKINGKKYIIQEKIKLSTLNDRPFDIRVILQKNDLGEWSVTGMLGKLAAIEEFVTNVGHRGEFDLLESYLMKHPSLSSSSVILQLEQLSKLIAQKLEKHCYLLGDLGFDFGVTNEGKIYFIECNFRSQYNVLKSKEYLYYLWKQTHTQPILYAKFLLNNL
ncbi:YheC/YheD family protein [Metabacillus bambusae]|uniref:YheC/YheD family protein n=1 Tax=Metabacillus bambusae TaxID=2795218 RepID=A0ABS3MWJ8_9BACI|nr:YheC/YheD family protein [Metabacillus bambusae]MBO1510275.1 YheC/YheD family protein [Metabacillus bambusae]